MSKVLDVGDCFSFNGNYGVVLENGKALLIESEGGRIGVAIKIKKGDIPSDAIPIIRNVIPAVLKFAIYTVLVAIGKEKELTLV